MIKDGNGDVLQRFDYYPFGSKSRVWTAGTSTPQSALRYRFGGKEIAGQEAGASALAGTPAAAAGSPYLDFGARLYDPRTAAWLSQDPMAEKYYPISPYVYCAGSPVNLVDPEGTDWYYLHQDGTIALGFEDKEDRDNDYLSLGYWETSSVGPSLFLRVPKAVNLGGLSQVNSSDNLSHAISSSDESIIDLFDFVIHHSANREWAIASFNGENGSRVYGLVQGKKGSSVMSPSEIDGLEESRMVAKIHTHEGYIEEHGASGDYREPLPYVITDRWNYKNMLERSKLYNFPMPDHYVYEVPFKVLYQYNERKGDIYKGKYKTGMFKQVLK